MLTFLTLILALATWLDYPDFIGLKTIAKSMLNTDPTVFLAIAVISGIFAIILAFALKSHKKYLKTLEKLTIGDNIKVRIGQHQMGTGKITEDNGNFVKVEINVPRNSLIINKK